NELGLTLFKRAQQELDDPVERDRFLHRAVEQYQSTLRIDPEDLDAHYGLAQCFALLGEAIPSSASEETANSVGRAGLLALGKVFAEEKEPQARRLQAGAGLARRVMRFGEEATDPTAPKLPVLQALINQCRPIYESATDEGLRAAAAHVLAALHRQA